MRILVAGATGSIGIHVVNTAIAMGHQPVTLVRNRRKIKLLPRGTDIFYGDVSIPETLTDLPKDIDAIIFTLGSDGQGRIGARAIDYGGVRNILRIFMDTPVRIALMTTIGVTERLSSWNYRGAYGNTNVGYSRSGDSSQIYYGMSGGIIAHADGITFGQPLGDTMVLVKAPGADNVKIENQTGIHTDWRGYAILPFATEYRENRVALNANSLADNVELDETVVTVIPTHGAIARATFNAQIGGKVLMTLKYGNKSVPFGAIVTHGENKNGSIVAENGQVYLTGLPQSGKLQVSWGKDKNSNCIVDYKLPVVSPGTLLNQQTAICR